ncbi:FkbM family methyltransferase [Roseicyclus sp.]|uniref:FkbM family methyltransferase n=1 Tax=Roseicyclus sp. TaxID=1914329 RepID=UPI003FA0488C
MTPTDRALSPDETAAVDERPWGAFRPNGLQSALIGLARRSFLQRGTFRHWTTNLITALGSPLDIEWRGCRYRIEGKNNLIEYGMLLRRDYNGAEIDFLLGTLGPGGVALDIGSNIGLYSLPMARAVGPSGTVVAIDANPAMAERLRLNARASGVGNVHMVNCAVGGGEGMVDLRIRKDDVAIVRVEESATGTIPMRTLASILRELGVGRVDALKIDIEGHEDAALVPFLHEAQDDALRPRRIVIEHPRSGDDYHGCAAAFARHGYTRVGQTRSNSLYARA